ncbi:hypothetical protein HMPREF1018_01640, partial [Bacteroides fragilis]
QDMQRFVGTLHRGKRTFWENEKWSIQTISFQHNQELRQRNTGIRMERKKKNQEGKR